MKLFTFLAFALALFGTTSCIEIIDDISIKNDGSGTLKYTVNLSSSKVKINSILALDSLEGQKVPTIEELQDKITSFKNKLEGKPGISNVVLESNFTDFIFKLQCDFTNVTALQTALKEVIQEESKEKNIPELEQAWLSWDGQKMVRSIPEITVKKTKDFKQEDIDKLKEGNYTSISRFERSVDKFDNPSAILSKNKMAVMIKTNPYALTQNPDILENTIYLSPLK
jgi:hypothetical protein